MLESVKRELSRESLKSSIMRQIQCKCGRVLDVSRDIEVTALERTGPTTEEVRFVRVWCSVCWDRAGNEAMRLIEDKFPGFTFEVIDGREL